MLELGDLAAKGWRRGIETKRGNEVTKTDYEKHGWRRYESGKHVYPHAVCFYQKELTEDVFVEIVKYYRTGPTQINQQYEYEVCFQIRNRLSPVGRNINVKIFSYFVEEADIFEKAEKDAREILMGLGVLRKQGNE